jgi:hypothetical protein
MKKREESYDDSDDAKNLIAADKRETAEYNRSQMSDEPGATEPLRAAATRMGANPPMARTYTKKGPVVTKEQMKKAGFDNLRDYLNAERGLTRRKDTSAPKATPAAIPKAEPAKAEPAKAEPAKAEPSRSRISQAKGSMAEKMRALGINRYKSGGSVKSSASKRADGCAVRGKTRGKVL